MGETTHLFGSPLSGFVAGDRRADRDWIRLKLARKVCVNNLGGDILRETVQVHELGSAEQREAPTIDLELCASHKER